MSLDVDLTGIETDARARLTELRQQRERLALDGLADPEIAEELRSVESEIASKETVLERIGLAKVEAQRRADAQAAEERAEALQEAFLRAKAAHAEREKTVRAMNEAADRFAALIASVFEQSEDLELEYSRAGLSEAGVIPADWAYEHALIWALEKNGVPGHVRGRSRTGPFQLGWIEHKDRVPLSTTPFPEQRPKPTPVAERGELPEPEQPAQSAGAYYLRLRREGFTIEHARQRVEHSFAENRIRPGELDQAELDFLTEKADQHEVAA